MAKVSKLKIQKQSGTSNTYFATWEFNEYTKNTTVSSGSIKKGSWVTIKSSATTWYNGSKIDNSWGLKGMEWNVVEAKGNRIVLGKNRQGTHNIMSPIHLNNLNAPGGKPSTTTINTLDHYTVKWTYDTGDGVWFEGGSSDVKVKNDTYSAPEGSLRIKATVTPVSKKHKVNNKDTSYWSGSAVSTTYSLEIDPPEKPSVPSVEIDKFKLTAKIENIQDPRSDQIQFELYNGVNMVYTTTINVVTARAIFTTNVNAGGEYRVRARSVNLYGSSKIYSEWSDYSASQTTIPSTPSGITVIRATSSTSIYLEWGSVTGADSYDIEYTTDKRYFEGSDQTTTITGIEQTKYEKTGLESGKEYFFRVRATNDKGSSSWTDIKSVIIGKVPAAPTTWSSTTTAIVGDPLTLYWVHNAEDNSKMTYGELELTIDGKKETHTIEGEGTTGSAEDDEEKTYFYDIDTNSYKEGSKILWRVRTAGITKQYGDWSIMRTVDIYAPPTLELTLTNTDGDQIQIVESFPFFINGKPGPYTQMPISYHISIQSKSTYETVNQIGETVLINAGDEIFSKYIDTNEFLKMEISASDIDLENNKDYTIVVSVSMDSGLTKNSTIDFSVSWTDILYEPDAEISVDKDTLTAFIQPYVIDDEGLLIDNLMLSVYRREFDGSYTQISSNMNNIDNVVVTDPHPALDWARYRIVAISKDTGSVSFYDVPGYPVNEHFVVIQWDEAWKDFNVLNQDAMVERPWSGSMIKVPWNIDISEDTSVSPTLVQYVGRKRAVSYYGTEINSESSWKFDIEKSDVDTLFQLRRLMVYQGDCYVREPSGSGYWATVRIKFDKNHNSMTIPVNISITRVEGGK